MACIGVVNALLKLLIAYLILIGEDRLVLYSFLTIVVQLIWVALYVFYSLRLNKCLSFRPVLDKVLLRKLIGFSGWNLFGSLAHAGEGAGLNLLLGMFFSQKQSLQAKKTFFLLKIL